MSDKLAVDGGQPVRDSRLPYGRQWLDDDDIQAVVEVLQSDWLTTGPEIAEFENAFLNYVNAREAVAVSNGTAALHAAIYAADIGPGDEVIVPPMTFAASANCVLYQGGKPVFADVDQGTLLIDPQKVEEKITPNTKAVIAVDYTGQPCDYDQLRQITNKYDLTLIADACHAIGGSYKGRAVGSLADLNTFSFHPVKHITTGEGGMISTDQPQLAEKMRIFRNHGITTDHRQREEQGSWLYEMVELGYNYRLTDFQCVLGLNQLRKLPGWIERRQEIARNYTDAFEKIAEVTPLTVSPEVSHAYHLYMIQLETDLLNTDRSQLFRALVAEGIGVNVHYIPVHLHPYYQEHLGTGPGDCPVAESAYQRLITLPIFPQMNEEDVDDVIMAIKKVVKTYKV